MKPLRLIVAVLAVLLVVPGASLAQISGWSLGRFSVTLTPNGGCMALDKPYDCCTAAGAGTCTIADVACATLANGDCTALDTPWECCSAEDAGTCPANDGQLRWESDDTIYHCDGASETWVAHAAAGGSGDNLSVNGAAAVNLDLIDSATVLWTHATAPSPDTASAAVPAASTTASGVVELATDGENAALVVVQGDDARLSDARTPAAHASSHQDSGSDEVATATPGANVIPKAGAGGELADGFVPAAVARDAEVTSEIATHAGIATAHHADSLLETELDTLSELNIQLADATLADGPHDGTGTDDQLAAEVPYTPDDGAEWTDPDPTEVDAALENLGPRVLANDAKVTDAGPPATADVSDVSVTQTEFAELETIGATTISANQWSLLGGVAETLGFAELNLLDGLTVLSGSNTGDNPGTDTLDDLSDDLPTALSNVTTINDADFCQGNAGSGFDCDVTQNAGTAITADLEEEAQIGTTTITGNAADDQYLNGTATDAATWRALPAGGTDGCSGSADKPIYTASTNSWSCGADAGAGGGMTSFTIQADDAATMTVTDGETVDVAGGLGLTTTAATGSPEQLTVVYDWSQTLAGNPALLVDQCISVATAAGGGFLCEGSTADTNEELHLFPDDNEADTTRRIVLDTATQSLTNKTINTASNTLTVVEADISDLQAYLTAETNDLSVAVTWTNVPDANVDGSAERDEVCGTTDLSSSCEINAGVIGQPDIDDTATLAADPAYGASAAWFGTTGLLFEGLTANGFEGLLASADVSADRTWTLPDATGEVSVLGQTIATGELAFSDFHDIGGTDDDVPESGDFGAADDLETTGAISANAVALAVDTTGPYVEQVADGTGIDGTANAEAATYTPTLDLTEVNNVTWGDNTLATITHTWDPTGAASPVWSYSDGVANLSTGALQVGGVAVDTGGHFSPTAGLSTDHGAAAVGDTDIAAGAVDGGAGGEIADGTVDANDLATNAVSADELNAAGVEAELEAVLDHDDLQGFVADEHVAHSGVNIDTASPALTGGGSIDATRTLDLLYTSTLAGNPAMGAEETVFSTDGTGGGLIFEGATADTIEGLLIWPVATSDKTLTLPNETGTVCSTGSVCTGYEPAAALSGVGTCTAQFARALNDGAGPTCESITDADVPDGITIDLAATATTANAGDSATGFFSSGEIEDARVVDTLTASNYLPLAGGAMSAEFTADALGIEFEAGDAITDCSTFSATGGGIFFDDSEGVLKKCEDNVLSDLDAGGAETDPTLTDDAAVTLGDGAGATFTGTVDVSGTDLTFTWNGTALDFSGPVAATSFAADASPTPSVILDDSDDTGTTDGSLAVNCPTATDCDMTLAGEVGGVATTWADFDADSTDAGGAPEVTLGGGHTGAVVIGSADMTSLTVTADGATDADVILPANSIGDAEVSDTLTVGSGGSVDPGAVGAAHIDAIAEIATALTSGLDGELITGTIATTNAVLTVNADDDLVELGAPLTWNVTAATCTGDGNAGALTVNVSNEIVCSADDGGAGSGAFSDAGDPIVQNTTTKDVVIGTGSVNTSKLTIDGDADQVQLTVDCAGTNTDSCVIVENGAGAEILNIDKGGELLVAVGLDAIGAVDMDYGSADVTAHEFTTDGAGTAEVVLPAGSIDSTEILDATVAIADLAAGTDGQLITWDVSGNAAVIATGTATHVLTSNGAGAAPTFQAAAAGGSVTKRLNLINPWTQPDSSGDVFFQPFSNVATNDVWDQRILTFNDTSAQDCVYLASGVPQDYTDTANVVVVWSSSVTTGDVEWDVIYRAVGGNDTESLDQATAQQTTTGQNDTAPSAAWERMEYTIAVTDGNFAAGDTVTMQVCRDGVDGGDTLVGTVHIFGLFFEYST